jgi:PAS domain S-box-containing protein
MNEQTSAASHRPRADAAISPEEMAAGGSVTSASASGGHGSLRALKLLLFASVLFPLLLFGAVAVFDRMLTLRAAEREMLATLDTVHGHAEKVFEFQTLMLGAVVEQLRGTTEEETRRDAPAHHAYLRMLQGHSGGALGLAVFGADGRSIVDSNNLPAPAVQVGDREYFRWHRDHPGSEPFVSGLIRSRAAAGAPTFFVSVRRPSAGAEDDFAGVVATGIRQVSFSDYWTRAVGDPDSVVVLVRQDGTVLARRPTIDPSEGLRLPPEALAMRAVAAGLERQVVRGVSHIDGKERLLAYRRLERFPQILIAHGVAPSAALRSWHQRLGVYAALAAATVLALSSLVLLARRRTAALIGEVAERRRAEMEVRDLAGTLERRVADRTAEVRAGEAKFRNLLESSPEKMWVNRPDGSVEWFNAAWRDYTGQPAIPVGAGWAEAVHAEDRDRVLTMQSRAVAAGEPRRIEMRLRRAGDGAWRWHLGSVAPIRDGRSAEIGAWVGTAADVHDIREATARLRDSEAQLRVQAERVQLALAAGAILGTWDWELPTDRFTVDERFAESFGIDPALGHSGLSLEQVIATVHPDDLAGLRAAIAEAIARGGAYSHEYRVRGLDGIYRWIEANGRVDLGPDGTPLRFPGVLLDIETRRALEAERDRAAALLRAFVAAVPGVVYAKDRAGRMLVANEGTAALVGKPVDAILGRTDAEFLDDPEQAAAVIANDRRIMEGGTAEQVEEAVSLAGGTPAVWLSTKAPFRDGTGEVVGLIGASVDITERKQAEALLRESEASLQRLAAELERRVQERTERLAEANGELEAFAHSVAHDLRAPLRTMQGFAAALEEDYAEALDALGRDYLARIMRGASRLDELIRDLLTYSRITREELQISPVDLDGVATEVLAQLRAAIGEKDALVTVESPLPPVLGHRAVLSQALLNLVSNALKFVATGVRPKVGIRAEARPEGRVRLWVEDNGIGISPAHSAQIFEVFQRLHGSEEYPGTGIGLAIVRGGVERLGGSAGLESTPGEGSRFWIELRLAKGTEE